MASTTRDYLDALLALSGNPLLVEVRQTLLEKLSDKELGEIGASCLQTDVSRQSLEKTTAFLLDIVSKEAKAAVSPLQVAATSSNSKSLTKRKQTEPTDQRKKARVSNRAETPKDGYKEENGVIDLGSEWDGEDSESGK